MNREDLLRKLRFKEGLKSRIINAPQHTQDEFANLDFTSSEDKSAKHQFTILFTKNKGDVDRLAKSTIDNNKFDSIFWFSFFKFNPMKLPYFIVFTIF